MICLIWSLNSMINQTEYKNESKLTIWVVYLFNFDAILEKCPNSTSNFPEMAYFSAKRRELGA